MKLAALLTASAASLLAVPATAQNERDTAQDFNGPYISTGGGASLQGSDRGETLVFDTDGDGVSGDAVGIGGVDAFAPGFCNGRATSPANGNCRNDRDGPEYFGRLGYDKRMGNVVLGALVEGGRSVARDSVSGFSNAPASYEMSRKADWQASARLRAGYTPGGGALFYVTGGPAYARLNNRFATTNTANSFADNGKTNGWGYAAGGGAEIMVTNNIAVGLEYLYTDLKDKDYTVNVAPGTAGATTNAFGAGTDIRRSDPHFRTHSVRGTLSFRF